MSKNWTSGQLKHDTLFPSVDGSSRNVVISVEFQTLELLLFGRGQIVVILRQMCMPSFYFINVFFSVVSGKCKLSVLTWEDLCIDTASAIGK
jgi:hypothetical protein